MKAEYELSDLGIAPALVYAIFQVAVVLFQAGYTYYNGLQQARRQQREQRYLDQLEMSQLAELLVSKYPDITYDEWLDYVKATNLIYPPGNLPPLEQTDWTKYLPYAIVGVILILVIKK